MTEVMTPTFVHGQPVWAYAQDLKLWWPARVITCRDAINGPGDPQPALGVEEEMVEYFSANNRRAVVSPCRLRDFLDKRNDKINQGKEGEFEHAIIRAVGECTQYAMCTGMLEGVLSSALELTGTKLKENLRKRQRQVSDMVIDVDAQPDEVKEKKKKKRKKTGDESAVETDDAERDPTYMPQRASATGRRRTRRDGKKKQEDDAAVKDKDDTHNRDVHGDDNLEQRPAGQFIDRYRFPTVTRREGTTLQGKGEKNGARKNRRRKNGQTSPNKEEIKWCGKKGVVTRSRVSSEKMKRSILDTTKAAEAAKDSEQVHRDADDGTALTILDRREPDVSNTLVVPCKAASEQKSTEQAECQSPSTSNNMQEVGEKTGELEEGEILDDETEDAPLKSFALDSKGATHAAEETTCIEQGETESLQNDPSKVADKGSGPLSGVLYSGMRKRDILSMIYARDIELRALRRQFDGDWSEATLAVEQMNKLYDKETVEDLIALLQARDFETLALRRLLE